MADVEENADEGADAIFASGIAACCQCDPSIPGCDDEYADEIAQLEVMERIRREGL